MITIVTGKMNEGKTTTLKHLYDSDHKGDGFIAIKRMDGSHVHSFLATKLSTDEQKIILLHKNYDQEIFMSAGMMGPYIINLLTLNWIERSIENMIDQKVEPIYLDEIGMFELRGYGYDRILRKMIDSHLDLVFTVRDEFLDQVKAHYHLNGVKVIKVSDRSVSDV